MDSMQNEVGRKAPFTPSSHTARALSANHVPAANLTYAYAGFGAVLGILFGIATAATLHQTSQTAQSKTIVEPPMVLTQAPVVEASFVAPEEKDMGSVSLSASGLKGHLTTTWSEKLGYNLVVGPTDPSEHDAFALMVSNPPRPLSVDVQLQAAGGKVLCDQQVVVKYGAYKAGTANLGQLEKAAALEQTREQANDVFQNNLAKDGSVESISSNGTMPCSKEQYDSATFWSFKAQFPGVEEQARLLKHANAAQLVEAKAVVPQVQIVKPAVKQTAIAAVKLPSATKMTAAATVAQEVATPKPAPVRELRAAPVAPVATEQLAEVQKPAAFHFEIEGDDEIVEFNASQRSLETSAGKTFFVNEALVASSVASWLDEQPNVHYRCDETSSCTLSLASATVLHATMRSHHSSLVQTEMLSMTDAPATPATLAMVGPEVLGR